MALDSDTDTGNLRDKVIVGTLWTVSMRLLVRFAGLFNVAILARILSKEDFGIVAILFTVVLTVSVILDTLVRTPLMRMTRVSDAHYEAAFYLRIIAGIILFLILIFSASFFEGFFAIPDFALAIQAMSVVTLVESFKNPRIIAFQRSMQFNRDFIYEVTIGLTRVFVSILASLWLLTYWGIIVGIAVSVVTGTILSHVMCKRVIRLPVRSAVLDIWKIMRLLIIEIGAGVIYDRFDRFVLGRLSDIASLGIFSVIMDLVAMPISNIIAPIARAILPGYHHINRSESGNARQAYTLGTSGTIALCIPIAIGMILTADPLVRTLLSDEWGDAVYILQLSTAFAFLEGCNIAFGQVLVAENQLKTLVKISWFRVLLFLPLLLIAGFYWGIEGAVIAKSIASACYVFIVYVICMRRDYLDLPGFAFQIIRSLGASLAMMVVLLTCIPAIEGYFETSLVHFLLEVVIGALTYGVAGAFIWYVSRMPDGIEQQLVSSVKARLHR